MAGFHGVERRTRYVADPAADSGSYPKTRIIHMPRIGYHQNMPLPTQPAATSNREIISVTDLNRSARRLLEGELGMVFVEGEISNFTRPSSGHWYLTLKDNTAQVRCAMFANRNRLVRFPPRNGMQVVLRGRVSLYEGRGEFQLIGEFMEEAGDGALRHAFDKLKAKLESEGLFATTAKQTLPAIPAHIGVITSPTGAAIRDVLHVLQRRFPAIPVSIIPVQVQGDDAARQIVAALDFANRYTAAPFDLLLLTRGGGSLEDLWSFNTEPVARAIFASRIPVVSAVGHETDFTIADFVADLRASTPSAAAELISPDGAEWQTMFLRLARDLSNRTLADVRHKDTHLAHLTRRLRHPGTRLQDLHQRIDGLEIRLRSSLGRQLDRAHARTRLFRSKLGSPLAQLLQQQVHVTHSAERMQSRMLNELRHLDQRIGGILASLHQVSPMAVLDRGYAIVRRNEEVLSDASAVEVGDTIKVQLMRGSVTARVEDKAP